MDRTDRRSGEGGRTGRGLFGRRREAPRPGRPSDDEVLHQYLERRARAAEAEAAELRMHLASMRERLRERDRAVASAQAALREAGDDAARRQAELEQLAAQLRVLEEVPPVAGHHGDVDSHHEGQPDSEGDPLPFVATDGVRTIPLAVPVELIVPTSDA